MLISCGDLHLSNDRPWSLEVGERIVKFLLNSPHNTKENTLVLLGDLTERNSTTGFVYSLLLELFAGLNYKEVVILMGNHDGKLETNGKVNLLYDFLTRPVKSKIHTNIRVIMEPTVLDLEGLHCLMLPHVFPDGKRSLKDYESLTDIISKDSFNIIFGHFTNTTCPPLGERYNVEYLNTDYWCFGHIHNPSQQYQGSLVPNSVAESKQKRHLRIYTKNNNKTQEKLEYLEKPISEYYSVKYPDPLPDVDAMVPIWTVYNCKSNAIAISQYGDIHIRNCIYDLSLDKDAFNAFQEDVQKKSGKVSIKILFEEFIKGFKYPDNIIDEARSIVKTL